MRLLHLTGPTRVGVSFRAQMIRRRRRRPLTVNFLRGKVLKLIPIQRIAVEKQQEGEQKESQNESLESLDGSK